MYKLRFLLAWVCCTYVLAGCTVPIKPLTDGERLQLTEADARLMFESVPAIEAPLAMEEAIARSLKYNLDHRLTMVEAVMRLKQLDASRYDMLPELIANAGWIARSNDYLTADKGQINPTESQDRDIFRADLGLAWNVLDFGASYYQAKQNADEVLIAQERQRKIVNQIVQEVRAAYWRAATSELLKEEVDYLMAEARQALLDSRSVERDRLAPPIDALQYQKGLLEIVRELEQLQRDQAIAKSELSGLMGLPPGTSYQVALPDPSGFAAPEWKLTAEEMEAMALLNRPELREEQYQKRIAAYETRKVLLRMLPGLNFEAGVSYDSNSFLVNNQWADAGMRVTWNLLNLLIGPKVLDLAEAQQEVGEWRRMALSMAVLTQVHVAFQEYLRALHAYQQATELNAIEQRIYGHISNAAQLNAQTALQQIRARLSAVYADVGQYYAYSDLQGAYANLHATLGRDLLPPEVINQGIPEIQSEVKKTFANWYEAESPNFSLLPKRQHNVVGDDAAKLDQGSYL